MAQNSIQILLPQIVVPNTGTYIGNRVTAAGYYNIGAAIQTVSWVTDGNCNCNIAIQATLETTPDSNVVVTGARITNPGAGYTSPPTVTFSNGGGAANGGGVPYE